MDRANLDLRPKSHAISPLPGRQRSVIRPLPIMPLPKSPPPHGKMPIKPRLTPREALSMRPKYSNAVLPWLGHSILPGWTSENVRNLHTVKTVAYHWRKDHGVTCNTTKGMSCKTTKDVWVGTPAGLLQRRLLKGRWPYKKHRDYCFGESFSVFIRVVIVGHDGHAA